MTQYFLLSTERSTALAARLNVEGVIDQESVALIGAAVMGHLETGRLRIRLDASRAYSIQDEALDELARLARHVRRQGGTLTMCGVARERLFQATHAAGPALLYAR